MSDREYFMGRAAAERRAALAAANMPSFRVHMDMAQEYERRAAAEPVVQAPVLRVR
jgi:hypothetical protein